LSQRITKILCALAMLNAMAGVDAHAQAFTTLLRFNGTDGANPTQAPLIQAMDGDLYGTTADRGANGGGTVFKITTSGALTTIYSFCSQSGCTDGENPWAALVQAANGDFYGTTENGGDAGYGTVFKITPAGALTTLHSFCSQTQCTDGGDPVGLVQAGNGDFYGTTGNGGDAGLGTVFKITPSGALTTLYSFCLQTGCPDGYGPQGLAQGADGNFYGTTFQGGNSYDGGTVFKITPAGALTTLYSFCFQSDCIDGDHPLSALIQATDGDLYGTTEQGGLSNQGTVFKITLSGALTTLYSFCALSGCVDGAKPFGALVQATNGELYGTTYEGGAAKLFYEGGTIFKITPAGALTTLYSFCVPDGCTNGSKPYAALLQATNGDLYGSTWGGGSACYLAGPGCGTIFRLSLGLSPFVETLPTSGDAGTNVRILGTDLIGATSVTFNGNAAIFNVVSSSEITTIVPPGATTGKVEVSTPAGILSSKVAFHVVQ
jgi:uncharacterized repeat protein (TIGR03803 family)